MKAQAENKQVESEDPGTPLPFGRETARAFVRNKAAVVGGTVVLLILLTAAALFRLLPCRRPRPTARPCGPRARVAVPDALWLRRCVPLQRATPAVC